MKPPGVGNCLLWSALFKAFGVVVCFGGFLLQTYEIFVEFMDEQTSIGIAYNVEAKIALPSITICPAKTMKYPIDKRTVTEEEFLNATYAMEELILPVKDNVTSWKFKTEV